MKTQPITDVRIYEQRFHALKWLIAAAMSFPSAASALAEPTQDWHVLQTAHGVYAFDKGSITTEDNGVRSVWVLYGTREGADSFGYLIDCRTNRGLPIGGFTTVNNQETWIMTEGSVAPFSLGWRPIEFHWSLQLAAQIACEARVPGATHVDSEEIAIERLKALSN